MCVVYIVALVVLYIEGNLCCSRCLHEGYGHSVAVGQREDFRQLIVVAACEHIAVLAFIGYVVAAAVAVGRVREVKQDALALILEAVGYLNVDDRLWAGLASAVFQHQDAVIHLRHLRGVGSCLSVGYFVLGEFLYVSVLHIHTQVDVDRV